MKRTIACLFVCLLFPVLTAFSQTDWQFTSHIEREAYYLLRGRIDGRYPITMYLTLPMEFCGEARNVRWKERVIRGWYLYDRIGRRIPLLGSMRGDNPEYFARLYVPDRALDTLDSRTCEPPGFREVFIAERTNFQQMSWRQAGDAASLPVELEVVHPLSWETRATVTLEAGGIALTSVDLTGLTGVAYIDSVEVAAAREIDGQFYAVLRFEHRSAPGSSGAGMCGAGYERFLAFIHLDEHLQLAEFEHRQVWSCLGVVREDLYTFDPAHPERGLLSNE